MARQWLLVFGELYRTNVAGRHKFVEIWVREVTAGLTPETLERAFEETARTCKFFPTPADVRQHVAAAEKLALRSAGDRAWETVLDHVRLYVWPDGGKFGPELPPSLDFAVRAAGGLARIWACSSRELEFAKQQFLDGLNRWCEQSSHLIPLPDGPIKKLITGVAETKKLPAPGYAAARERGEAYRRSLAATHAVTIAKTEVFRSAADRDRAIESLSERETNPELIEKIQRDKQRLAEWERKNATARGTSGD